MSGEAAAIGVGFLLGGPVGAVIGGAVAPAALAALMWRSRQAEHDENSNDAGTGNGATDRAGSRDSSAGGGRNQGRGNGRGNGGGAGRSNGNGSGGGRRNTPKGNLNGAGGGHKKPRTKDPIADKLGKLAKGLGNKIKPNKADKHGPDGKSVKHGKDNRPGTDPKALKGDKTPKAPKDGSHAKGLKDGLRDGLKVKDRGKQPDSDRPWRGRGPKNKRKRGKDDDASSSTARDGLDPKGGGGAGARDEFVDAELVDDDLPPKPDHAPGDVIDGDVVDEDRITLVKAKREKQRRREAIAAGKKAAEEAARDGDRGDPHQVKLEVIREHNRRIDLEIHHENQRLALAAAAEKPRSTPVNYPAIVAAPAGTRTAGTAIARQVDPRTSTAYAILRAMADQLANGLHHDDDADMADHVIELFGIPIMCRNLGTAVRAAAEALSKTAPLHPTVIKHLNNAAVAAMTAQKMSESIILVFVESHREDMLRVLSPRVGEERWNIRNGPGTLDAAKMRAAITSANAARNALPPGASSSSGKLVPASDGSTKKLITLMKGFTKGHMVNVLSEVAGSAAGVEVVADSITKLYRRMSNTWPTERAVDETVRATASKIRTISDELRKAIRAAQKAHQRELRLNAKGRAGKGARVERKWDVVTRRGSSN